MNLTREQAIAEHRKMWNWIADKIESLKIVIDITSYKKEYLYIFKTEDILSSCFMCEYTRANCEKCPLDWGHTSMVYAKCLDKYVFRDNKGPYELCVKSKTWQEQAALARQIANLPEREDI